MELKYSAPIIVAAEVIPISMCKGSSCNGKSSFIDIAKIEQPRITMSKENKEKVA